MHLIMNSLANVISRFNSQLDDTTDKSSQIFKSWCKTLDQKCSGKKSDIFAENKLKLMENVPCHSEFYRFISQPNFVFSITRSWDFLP